MSKHEPRSWQKTSFQKIDDNISKKSHAPIMVNACVGSGKTDLACHAFGKFIIDNFDKKTFQIFVTPRIKLCSQQAETIKNYVESEFNLKCGKDFDILRRDCSQGADGLNLRSDTFTSKHSIIVICDESLWGIDKNKPNPDYRWNMWQNFFNKLISNGYIAGFAICDEAHNFTNKFEKIFSDMTLA